MANSYTIKKTDGTVAVTILAGGANGDSGIANGHDTDLLLYGRGTFNWGSGIEQNLVRLTENWAYPAANGTATTNQQYPAISNTTGTGIKQPLKGQTWFNTTNNKLYVNVNGSNNAGSWRVDHIDYKYLELPKTTDQTMEGKLRIRTTNGQPDLYIESTTVGYGIGTGALGANQGASSFITFEGTDSDGDRTRGAFIANYHNSNTLRLALSDRTYTELDATTNQPVKKSYAGSAVLNYIQLETTQTVTNNEIRQNTTQTSGYGTGGIHPQTLTTSKWVYDYVTDYVTDYVEGNTYLDARYLNESDTTARIQSDGDARYLQLTGGTLTGSLDVFYPDAAITISAPHNPTNVDHNISLNFQRGSVALGEMYLLTGGDVTTDLVGTFDQSAYTADSKLIIRKNDGGEVSVNGFVIYDDEIRTHHTRGKIHTPETVNSDANDTLTTKGYVDTKVSSVDLSSYYVKNDTLSISRTAADSDLNPAIFVSAEDVADITIETTGTSTDSEGRVSFKTNGGYRGFVGMLTKVPTGTEDTLVVRKMQGNTTYNEIQVQDELTQFKKRLVIDPNDNSKQPGITFQATTNFQIADQWLDSETIFDEEISNGIIWRNNNESLRAGIQFDNKENLRIMLTPDGGTGGGNPGSVNNTRIELQKTRIAATKPIVYQDDAIPDASVVLADNQELATNHQLTARTYRDYKRTTTAAAYHYQFSGGVTWQVLGTNVNATITRGSASNTTVEEFPTSTISIGLMRAESLAQSSMRLDISIPAWISTDSDNPSLRAVPMNMEYQVVYDNASNTAWTTFTVCQVWIWEDGSSQVTIAGSPIINIPNPDTAVSLRVRFKLDDVGLYPRVTGPYNSTAVGVGVIDSYWV